MNKCIGIGRIFGHKFEPRYNFSSTPVNVLSAVDSATVQAVSIKAFDRIEDSDYSSTQDTVQAMYESFMDNVSLRSNHDTKTTYIHSVCTRCGAIISHQ